MPIHTHHDAPDVPAALPWPTRRRLLGVVSGLGAAALWGCGGGDDDTSTDTDTGTATGGGTTGTDSGTGTGTTASCTEVPSETNGPYPADGTTTMDRLNYNVLQQDGIVRSDIRQSIGGGDVQAGAMLTLNITLTGTLSDCASLAGYAVYIWHCTSAGDYSVYTESSVTRNYLRGVQATGSDGKATFVTVMPGCYEGRMPHIHVEIYPSLAEASSVSNVTRITQLAFPSDVMQALYGTQSDYSDSVRPFSNISFEEDNVFSDGYDDQMLTITGDSANGYVGEITISIAA